MASLINLTRGSRVKSLLKFDGEYTFSGDYLYIEVGLGQATAVGEDGHSQVVKEAIAGSFVKLKPAGSINPARGTHAIVVINGLLSTVGSVSYQSIIAPGDGEAFGASVKLNEAFDFSTLPWLARIYLID